MNEFSMFHIRLLFLLFFRRDLRQKRRTKISKIEIRAIILPPGVVASRQKHSIRASI